MEKREFQNVEEVRDYIGRICDGKEFGKQVHDIDLIKEAEKVAREKGEVEVLNNIASIYYEGNGITQNQKKAFQLYKECSGYGDSTAMSNLGFCYYFGNGTDKDLKEALNTFIKGTFLKSPEATYMLADMYWKGEIVPQDKKFAYYLYKDVYRFFSTHVEEEDLFFQQVYSSVTLRLAKCNIFLKNYDKAEYFLGIAKYYYRKREKRNDYYTGNHLKEVELLEKKILKLKEKEASHPLLS